MEGGGGESHAHCDVCYSRKCTAQAQAGVSCRVAQCGLHCGAVFHQCKAVEHRRLCPDERVACINAEYGCPFVLPRCKLAAHLSTCPASVVYCTMEWNRWPVYSKERKARIPFTQTNIHAQYGQLDVALAVRDQKVLNEAMKVPRSTRRIMRNNLTQRFPAVPLCSRRVNVGPSAEPARSTSTSRTVSDDEGGDAPWDSAPPGLQSSVCNELFKATKKATESLSAALSLVTEGTSAGPTCASASDDAVVASPESTSGTYQTAGLSAVGGSTVGKANVAFVCDKLDALLTKTGRVDDGLHCLNPLVHVPSGLEEAISAHGQGGVHGWTRSDHAIPEPPPTPPPLTLQQLLSLDLNLESITRYQAKPRSMYTFLCAQAFRRDEYPWHFSNVHSEIHGGLNGWIEQRCPLACYGCTYSIRRLHPMERGATIVYSPLLDSFGYRPVDGLATHLDASKTPAPPPLGVDHLPSANGAVEILTSKDYDLAVIISSSKEPMTALNDARHGDVNVDGASGTATTTLCSQDEARCLCSVHASADSRTCCVPAESNMSTVDDGAASSDISLPGCCSASAEPGRSADDKDYDSSSASEAKHVHDDPSPSPPADVVCRRGESLTTTSSMSSSTRSTTTSSTREPGRDLLTGLPFEVLQHVARFLDGFSLNHLAVTCLRLREVCCSLLEEKGIVLLEWEKVPPPTSAPTSPTASVPTSPTAGAPPPSAEGRRPKWVVAYKKWHYSSSFSGVTRWGFEDARPPMAAHLQHCYYKEPHVRSLPTKVLPDGHLDIDRQPDATVHQALRRMYPGITDQQCHSSIFKVDGPQP